MSLEYKSGNYRREPVWLPSACANFSDAPAELLSWLLDQTSLTKRLQYTCKGNFQVCVLSQYWRQPMINERRVLGMKERELAMIRHVHLVCGRHPLVFARTVIPESTMKGTKGQLAQLGNRPLGALLFSNKTVRRCSMEVARIMPEHTVFAAAMEGLNSIPEIVWGRRSLFKFDKKPILVNEVFLPKVIKTTVIN